jgi:20S proteasome subunit alpha 4
MNNNHQQEVYDRSVTTFNPNGHLLQVEYATNVISMKSNTIVIAMIVQNTTYIATVCRSSSTSSYDSEQEPQSIQVENQFIHRLSDNIYMIGIGLLGDINAIVSYIRVQIQQSIYNHDETMSLQQISNMICQLQHQCTYQSGIRPLGVSCLLFQTTSSNHNNDNQHHPSPHLFKCSPGGIQEDCNYCIIGNNEDRILESFHPYYSQFYNKTEEADIIELFVSTIQNILVSTTTSTSHSNNNDNNHNESMPMDVWVIRASSDNGEDLDYRNNHQSYTKNHTNNLNNIHTFINNRNTNNRLITCFAGLCNHPDSFQKMRLYYNHTTK